MKMETLMPGSLRNKTGYLAALLFHFFVFNLPAQRLQNISLSSAGGIVRIDFTVAKGSNCEGYKILHSTDSTFFNVVAEIPGICSSSFEDLSHTYNHTSPQVNAMNYYKIELAFVETSPIQRIYVSSDSRSILTAYPNPVLLSEGSIHFRTSSTENGTLEGFICDENGRKLQSLLLNCYDYKIDLPIFHLKTGIHFIWLSDGVYLYGSKFIISP
jgi:hypothetical protein